MTRFRCRRSVRALILLSSLALLSVSCGGSDRLPVYPVSGQVFYKGKPTPGAIVVFHPVGSGDLHSLRPSGVVQEDGTFLLSTYASNDGAPEGEFLVAISREDADVKFDRRQTAPNPKSLGAPRLPPAYAAAQTSKLRVTVQKGTNELSPFRLD